MNTHYPSVDLAVLQRISLIRRLASENPSFFEDSPYDEAVKAWFAAPLVAPVQASGDYPDLADADVEAEELLKHLKSLKNSLPNDTADQLAWVRAAATLLDKIVTVKERANSVKRMQEFEKLVIDTLQDVMTPEQRTVFQNRMAHANL